MRYIGSKDSCKEEIYNILTDQREISTVCDPFGGIGTIGSYFKSKGHTVWTGDILEFAHYFQVSKIEMNSGPYLSRLQDRKYSSVEEVITQLNNVTPTNGWLVENYSKKRGFFTRENAKKIQACWDNIRDWDKKNLLTKKDKAVLLSSLIDCMDKVANTAGTYYAYLKNWDRKAKNDFNLELISPISGPNDCKSFLTDARDLVEKREFDLVYLDPPYNGRQYSRYYHLPETIAKCREVEVTGKSGVPVSKEKLSPFSQSSNACDALQELIECANFDVLAVHYSDNGIIHKDDLRLMLDQTGEVDEISIKTMGYSSDTGSRTTTHQLYIVT